MQTFGLPKYQTDDPLHEAEDVTVSRGIDPEAMVFVWYAFVVFQSNDFIRGVGADPTAAVIDATVTARELRAQKQGWWAPEHEAMRQAAQIPGSLIEPEGEAKDEGESGG